MKIRIKGNSVRLRLTRSEVEQIGKDGYIEEQTVFGNAALTYALQVRDDIKELAAEMNGQKIMIYMPEAIAKEWTTTDTVGYDHHMDIGNDKKLCILIEKDFKCIDANILEDQSDNYENPLASCQ